MRTYIICILCAIGAAVCSLHTAAAAENNTPKATKTSYKQTVVLSCDLHCQGCCDKIMKNIAWEKGVKDIICDLEKKTVTVVYDTRKTDIDTLLKAFERIGKPAKVLKNNEDT